jgi:tetratricopeptide (TPR) repeat protein
MTTTFSSEGFDLDAASGSEDVVLEVGGGVTKVEEETKDEEKKDSSSATPSLIAKSEEHKEVGNDYFRQGAYQQAYDAYTDAIEACPGMTGEEILKEKEAFEEQEHALAMERQRKKWEAESRPKNKDGKEDATASAEKEQTTDEKEKIKQYKPPMHVYGDKLAVYHANRAAVCMHLQQYENAIRDCDIAILLNPTYTKAWVRRSSAHEKVEKVEEALADAKQAQQLDPSNASIRKNVTRLQKMEDERLEKLKEETLGKLKDLGNSILGNFGLSLDNFKATQGADGSYSIAFDQNAGKK